MWGVIIAVLVILFIADYVKKNMTSIPSHRAWPLIGNMATVFPYRHNILKFHEHNIEKFGDTYRVWGIGLSQPDTFLFTIEPEGVKHFLVTNFENYKRASPVPRFNQLFGQGIFTSNGDAWRFHRKMARPLFTKPSVEHMLEHFHSNGEKVLRILDSAAESKSTIDLQELFFRFTLDSFGCIGFGHSINSLDHDVPFSQAFNRTQLTIARNNFVPILRFLPDKQYDADHALLNAFVDEIIEKRRKEGGYKDRTDLLSRFMMMQDDDGKPLSNEYLRDMVLNFFVAGRDTTACLLSWTFYSLAKHPEIEKKLVDVIDTACGKSAPTSSQLNSKEMDYLRYVLDESLRLYPPVPMDLRMAINDDVLPNGTFVKAGTRMCYTAYHTGRSEKCWKDAQRYWPERWEDKESINKSALLAFHAGPQTCLGRPMAYLEAKALTTLILQHYHIELADPTFDAQPEVQIVMPIKGGLPVKVHRRVVDESSS